MLCTRSLLAVFAAALVWPAAAHAIQFDPPDTARLHVVGGGGIGAEFDTDGPGVGGQVSYDSGTGILSITGAVDVLNYYDPADLSCPVDSAVSNCAYNYAPDLDLSFTAYYDSMTVTPLGGTFVQVSVNFSGGAGAELIVTDPTDVGFGSVLEASLVAGTLGSTPITGLTATVVYNTATGTTLTTPTGQGVMAVDPGTNDATLFQPDYFGVVLSSLSAFVNGGGSGGSLNELIGDSIVAGTLQSFTAETEGQVLNNVAGSFVPEPSIPALLTVAFGAWAAGRSRRSGE